MMNKVKHWCPLSVKKVIRIETKSSMKYCNVIAFGKVTKKRLWFYLVGATKRLKLCLTYI